MSADSFAPYEWNIHWGQQSSEWRRRRNFEMQSKICRSFISTLLKSRLWRLRCRIILTISKSILEVGKSNIWLTNVAAKLVTANEFVPKADSSTWDYETVHTKWSGELDTSLTLILVNKIILFRISSPAKERAVDWIDKWPSSSCVMLLSSFGSVHLSPLLTIADHMSVFSGKPSWNPS